MSMPCTTTFSFEGHRIVEYKGLVRGLVVRAPTIAQGIMGGLKSVVGGKIGAYREMCESVRQEALDDLLTQAADVGANAVVGMRYESSDLGNSSTEVICYGTAVVMDPA